MLGNLKSKVWIIVKKNAEQKKYTKKEIAEALQKKVPLNLVEAKNLSNFTSYVF